MRIGGLRTSGHRGRLVSLALGALVMIAGCAGDGPGVRDDRAPRAAQQAPAPQRVLHASAQGRTASLALAQAQRAVVAQLRMIVGTPPESTAAYAGTLRREGFDTHLSSELLAMDRFEQSGDRVGLTSRTLPGSGGAGAIAAEAWLDTDAVLRAYADEIANAERVLAWMESERGRWSAESWAGVESLMGNVRAGRDWLAEARARLIAWRESEKVG